MRFRAFFAFIIAATFATSPALAAIHVENKTDAWVLANAAYPTHHVERPQQPAAICLAPGGHAAPAVVASTVAGVHVVVLEGKDCYAPRLFEKEVAVSGAGTVSVNGTGPYGESFTAAGSAVETVNKTNRWVLAS